MLLINFFPIFSDAHLNALSVESKDSGSSWEYIALNKSDTENKIIYFMDDANTEVAGDMARSAMITPEPPWAIGRCSFAGKT